MTASKITSLSGLFLLAAFASGCQSDDAALDKQVDAKVQAITTIPPAFADWPGVDFVALNSAFVGSPDRSFTQAEERVFGFESHQDWKRDYTVAQITNSNTHTEGDKSLRFQWVSQSNGYMSVRNLVPISKDDQPPPEVVGYDIMPPTQQVNPSWRGDTQLFLHSPSSGLHNQYVGIRPISNMQLGQFNRVEFTIPQWMRSQLEATNYQDLQFVIAINVPAQAAPHFIDRFTWGPDTGPAGAQVTGSVAVVNSTPGPYLTGAEELTVGVDTQLTGNAWADSIYLRAGSKVTGAVNFNQLLGPGLVQGATYSPLPLPLNLGLPTVATVQPGSQSITINSGLTQVIGPGAYANLKLLTGASGVRTIARLTGGLYQFASIEAGVTTAIYCSAACEIRVQGRMSLDQYAILGPNPTSGVAPSQVRVLVLGQNGGNGTPGARPSAFHTYAGADVAAYLHVPNATMRLVRGSQFEGRIVARHVLLGSGVALDGCAPSDLTCDGVDDDCDGFIDDDYVSLVTDCGVGACAAEGSTSCQAGVVVNSCVPGVPLSTTDTSCDGVDDDCNGSEDEEYQVLATTCGTGVCAAVGATSCVQGEVEDSCAPLAPPATSDTLCNGLDDDCDGGSDEDYVQLPTACGVGACQAVGQTQCVAGSVVNSCVPGTPAPSDMSCNGVDDDCNGPVDEGYQPVAVACGTGACAAVGQTACVSGAVQQQCTPGAPAASDPTCNGIDDDCDGTVDDNYVTPTHDCGVGACASSGALSCIAGEVIDQCVPGTPAGSDTTCDGVDDDCDGQADQGYLSQATACGVGACAAAGQTSCPAGQVVDSCQPLPADTSDTTCDGVDDDCDGTVDEEYASYATQCGEGVCSSTGATSCASGQEVDSCEPGTAAAADATCDGLDNDCDGSIDEDYVDAATVCGVGACAATGTLTCDDGALTDSCAELAPAQNDAICDGLDNDCDGSTDEDYDAQPTSCGVGACSEVGVRDCVQGQVVDSCDPGTPAPSDATCDGTDDDCNGQEDEDYAPLSTSCGVGACSASGQTQCVSGLVVDQCSPGQPAALDATCNGIDDDCDGQVDEDYVAVPTSCGVGACGATGLTSCAGGVESNSCSPGQPAVSDATCDGVDDDCDGTSDEDFSGGATTCGVGACSATGAQACVGGTIEDSCTPGTPDGSDITCDGVDDDCDGTTDEDYLSMATSCGVGACGALGSTSCVSGTEQDSCVASTPSDDDASCNGLDDDCDGDVDEDYVDAPTSCGVGACSNTGTRTCEAGSLVDDCSPWTGDESDTTCDGVDDDCDGSTDEEYLSLATSCGVGACGAVGSTSCVGGLEEDSCEPGTAAANDMTCDGLDNDCDGNVDENYVSVDVACGVGACAVVGASSCVSGVEQNTCSPGQPAADDSSCDAVDSDCDGTTDEDFVGAATTCGVGACGATGTELCIGGTVTDSCQPTSPGPADDSCNDVDDDCDGSVDEDYEPELVTCGAGACTVTTETSCQNGSVSTTCDPGEPATDDASCNATDDDCDGSVDEEFAPQAVSCGVGACQQAGTTTCNAGQVEQDCTPGVPASNDSVCDGADNDCDGAVDEDYQPESLSCGTGACATTGMSSCSGGVVQNQCVPLQPAAADASCDGIDDDCSGEADEDYLAQPTSCGQGQCASTGVSQCQAGHVVNSCAPGAPAASDASCNGLDDDCDGSLDEDYPETATTCGTGACVGSGTLSCVSGAEVDSCVAGESGGGDATCDGFDDDCDGQVDEDYVGTSISCGTGACVAQGTRSCSGGVQQDDCTPLAPPSATDSTCNGVDEDCNGQVDEDFVGATVTCGLGECQKQVTTTCVQGAVVSDCVPDPPVFMSDASCDNLDQDCDGSNDEDFASTDTSCGQGACAAVGQTACIDGSVVDQCEAGSPAASDATCDGQDDDCDGSIDENFVDGCAGSAIQSCENGTLVVSDCSNDNACDGAETCQGSTCQAGTPPPVEDGQPCTIGSCDPVVGVIQTPVALGTDCGGGLICDGAGNCTGVPEITTQPADVQVSVGQPYSLFVRATGAYLSYQWYRDGVLLNGATSAVYSSPAAQLSDSGAQFHVVVSNLTGSVTSNSATVTVGDGAGPIVELTTQSGTVTYAEPFTVRGSVTDSASGLGDVWIENLQLSGANIAVVPAADGSFGVDVPLVPGPNVLTLFAEDAAGNQTVLQLVVSLALQSTPVIQIVTPAQGSVVQNDRIDVAGIVRTNLPGNLLRIELSGQTVFPQGTTGEYDFLFEDVVLRDGRNDLTVTAVTPETRVESTVTVFLGEPDDSGAGEPPRVGLNGVQSFIFLTQAQHAISGSVIAETCVQSVSINGQGVQPIGTGGYVTFEGSVVVPDTGDPFDIYVEAIDCLGRTGSAQYTVVYDATAPTVSLSVSEAPSVTLADETPYRIYGSIAEPNLAGVAVGQQSIGVVPTGNDTWEFELEVPLVAGEQRALTLTVWDRAGNRSKHEVLLALESSLEIEMIAPTAGTQIQTLSDPVDLEVVVRIPGRAAGDRVSAGVDGGATVPLVGAGEVLSGTVAFPLSEGAHAVTVVVVDSQGALKARRTTNFSVTDASNIPLEVLALTPERGASMVEAHQPISLTFNRQVDSSKLNVSVTETGRAMSYAPEFPGADMLSFTPPRLQEIVRENETTPGGLSVIPGDQSFVFYPTREYVHGGTVRVLVTYDGQEVYSSSFSVRPVPTLFEGRVVDHELNPVANMEVRLGSEYVTTTAQDGAFSFGFGSVHQAIDGGRQLLSVNPLQGSPKYSTTEFFVDLQEGRFTPIGVVRTVRLDESEPYRLLAGGMQSVQFLDGALILDATEADFAFERGASEGLVHASLVTNVQFGFPIQGGLSTLFYFVLTPGGIEVSGELGVDMTLPVAFTERPAPLPSHLVISTVDPETRLLRPSGVLEVDLENGRLVSQGGVFAQSLDVVAVSVQVGGDLDAPANFAQGNLTIDALRSAVHAN